MLDTSFLASVAGIIADAVERVRRQAALQAALDARATLIREHHHRVRNNYQSLMSRLQRHARQATTEDSRRRLEDVEHRVFALTLLYDHLVGTEATEDQINFPRYLGDLCDRMRAFYGTDERTIELACECPDLGIVFDMDTCTALGAVVNELVANAVEHAFGAEGGKIDIRLRNSGERATLTVSDNGSGLRETRPESIGLSVVQKLVSGVGGAISAASSGGTTWTITLPPGGGGGVRAPGPPFVYKSRGDR